MVPDGERADYACCPRSERVLHEILPQQFGVCAVDRRSLIHESLARSARPVKRPEPGEGRLAAAIASLDDVTMRGVLESAPDAIVVVDERGRIILVNAQTEILFGYSRNELLGNDIELLVPEGARESHRLHRDRYHAAAIRRPMGSGIELHGRRKDGRAFPVEISLSPVETSQGTLIASA